MKTTSLKSRALKNSWILYRNSNNKFTWSEALTIAWYCAKNEVKAYVRKDFKGTVHLNYSKNNCHYNSIEGVIKAEADKVTVNNSGAKHDYMTGRYMGD